MSTNIGKGDGHGSARSARARVCGGPSGGNPAPIVIDAAGMSDAQMQEVARSYGHESGFVFSPPAGSDCDFEFRFWVPNHEMPMYGHATVGAVWLLEQLGRLSSDRLAIWTKSGRVEARVHRSAGQDAVVEVSQPAGIVEPVPGAAEAEAAILQILGIVPAISRHFRSRMPGQAG